VINGCFVMVTLLLAAEHLAVCIGMFVCSLTADPACLPTH
jgi:hypothetical protein